MNYPQNIEQKIGFDSIRTILNEYCKCDLGKELINSISFSNSESFIQDSLNQISEMKRILEFEKDFPTPTFIHINKELQSIKPEGTFLQTQDLFVLRKSLLEIIEIIHFFEKRIELYPVLSQNIAIPVPIEICKLIDSIIDSTGQLKDNASKQLIEIRSAIQQKKQTVAKIMNQKMNIARKENWLDSDTELTVRNGRLVLPMFTAYKRKIQGFVHDESITGKTSYLEPIEAFEINNDINSLEYEEQKEIIRILKEVTNSIRPHIFDIEQAYIFLGTIDAIIAKARLAIRLHANKPSISDRLQISLIGAKHPLLLLSFEKSGKEVIPLRVLLDETQRILVISGPNAGGKSVCLKCIVLLQYMFQCGLLISADEYSQLGVFSNIFIDIGDEQSLENDLSTYSSHLSNMKYFTTHADKKSLICIDEFGTGTEPMLGGAIAESVLESLHNQGVFGVITTHYTNLKHATSALQYAINGAMLFDLEKLKPMYKLRLGSAGSSFAFEIAKEIGLSDSIIIQAKNKIGKEHVDFDANLKKLEEEKQYIFKKKEELQKREDEISKQKEEYSQKLQSLSHKRLEVISDTKKEIETLLSQANKQIEQTIRIIKEKQAQKDATKQARESLESFSKDIIHTIEKQEKTIQNIQKQHKLKTNQIIKNPNKNLGVGDFVKIKDQTTVGEIIEISKKQAVVQFSHATMTIAIDNLEQAQKPKSESKSIIIQSSTKTISEKRQNFSQKLDVRGKRGDEALYEVKDFMETGHMLQIKHLEILHGKGYGILRKLIRDYIETLGFVESCSDAPIEMGGDGITIIKLS